MVFLQMEPTDALKAQGFFSSRMLMPVIFIILGAVIAISVIQIIKTCKLKNSTIIERERLARLGEITAGIIHNLKTPVMSISGSLEELKNLVDEYENSIGDKEVTDEDHQEIASEMRDHILKIKPYCSYLADVIDTVKEQAAVKKHSGDEVFTIEDIIKKVEILMGYRIKKATCKLNVDIKTDETFKIQGDINELVQVMNNLISNSIDSYENNPGEIDILIEKEKDIVKFKVTDYGKGMPKDVMKKLLKNIITTKGEKGTGLGLYISYHIIQNNFKGSIKIESEEEKGTTVYIDIPIKQANQ